MTYKEYYQTLNSIEEIKCAAADDIIIAQQINPNRIDIILDSANQVLKEKFDHEVFKLPTLRE